MDQKFKNLFKKIKEMEMPEKEKNDILKDLVDKMNGFVNYFNQVVKMEIYAQSITEWTGFTSHMYVQMDEERKIKHDICIESCNEINELCDKLNIDRVCNVDTDNRHDVAAFCGYIVTTMYMDGIKEERNFDQLVQEYALLKTHVPTKTVDDWEL